MRKSRSTLHMILHAAAILLVAGVRVSAAAQAAQAAPIRVAIETTLGEIVVQLDSARAPITVANFLRYVDAGAYTGGRFHRTVTLQNQPRDSVRIEVIQGGPRNAPDRPRFPAIELERTSVTGLRHVDGAISMARSGPNSATSDFFICIGDQPSLDFGGNRNADGQGFAAFGSVVSGMAVVRAIQSAPANAQTLTPAIAIVGVRRVGGPR